MTWICHTCGREKRVRTIFLGEVKVWTNESIVDRDHLGAHYDELIGQPHEHDWHKGGFTTHHGGEGGGDGDSLIPAYALDLVREQLRSLPVEERQKIYQRIISDSARWEDVDLKFRAEMKRLKGQSRS